MYFGGNFSLVVMAKQMFRSGKKTHQKHHEQNQLLPPRHCEASTPATKCDQAKIGNNLTRQSGFDLYLRGEKAWALGLIGEEDDEEGENATVVGVERRMAARGHHGEQARVTRPPRPPMSSLIGDGRHGSTADSVHHDHNAAHRSPR